MGIIRIYLALCVVAAHAGQPILPWPMLTSTEAVQIFFLISGFYMSLISTKYKTALEFYASRFLRIFIPYYVVLGVVVLLTVLTGLTLGNWLDLTPYIEYSSNQNGLAGTVIAALSNLTVFFQDWVMFLKHDPGQGLSFTTDFAASATPLYKYLLIRQAWTIGTELTFYLFVPLLGRLRTRWLVLIALASLGLRIYTYQVLGLFNDPFSYRFFPFELLLFVAGMIIQRVYVRTLAKWPQVKLQNLPQYLIFFAGLLFFFYLVQKAPPYLRRHGILKQYVDLVFYIGWLFVIPFFYHLTRELKTDRFIGELSYPIYLVHLILVQVADLILTRLSVSNAWLGVVSALLAVSVSAFLFVKLFKPIEERRQDLAHELSSRWAGFRKLRAAEASPPSAPSE
jgi:peptidoglycan/LPS O-acetylase OafA/YrhL